MDRQRLELIAMARKAIRLANSAGALEANNELSKVAEEYLASIPTEHAGVLAVECFYEDFAAVAIAYAGARGNRQRRPLQWILARYIERI